MCSTTNVRDKNDAEESHSKEAEMAKKKTSIKNSGNLSSRLPVKWITHYTSMIITENTSLAILEDTKE